MAAGAVVLTRDNFYPLDGSWQASMDGTLSGGAAFHKGFKGFKLNVFNRAVFAAFNKGKTDLHGFNAEQ